MRLELGISRGSGLGLSLTGSAQRNTMVSALIHIASVVTVRKHEKNLYIGPKGAGTPPIGGMGDYSDITSKI